MGRVLANEFSWSKSRHEKFSECLRAYYLYYYRSWGGWDRGAPEEAKELYLLKKLSNRFTWAGSVVHDSVKQALLTLRAGKEPKQEQAISFAHKRMQEDWRHSAKKAYRTQKLRKEFTGLVEHEYDEPVPQEDWARNWETVKGALEWFFASRWPALAKSLRREQWLEVDEGFEFSVFQLEGVKVFAIPDFAYVGPDGAPVVVDWKTGKAREGYDDQVLGYALYLSERYRFPLKDIKAQLVYLNDGIEHTVGVDLQAIEAFRGRMRKSVESMRSLLSDPAANQPKDEGAFPMTENLEACARCAFRRVCGRDKPVAAQVA